MSSTTHDLKNLTTTNIIFKEELSFKLYTFGIRVVIYQTTVNLKTHKLRLDYKVKVLL